MIQLPQIQDVVRFRDLISKQLGLHFDESKFNNLTKILHLRAQAKNENYTQYLDFLGAENQAHEEIFHLARELTVTETYFLRNRDQFKACIEVALPKLLADNAGKRPIRIFSAGCASGEEPYSLAIIVQEHFAWAKNHIDITALDINPAMLEKAAQARYTSWSLRDFPPELKARWFKAETDGFLLDKSIRQMVKFERGNLANETAHFSQPSSLDIVFCRNVLMYFSAEKMQAIIKRIAHAMTPGGYLFLGHAETLRGLSNDFHLCHTHGTFYYQRKEYLVEQHDLSQALIAAWQPAADLGDTSWVEAIRLATERIQALPVSFDETPEISTQSTQVTPPVKTCPAPNLNRALEYLQNERYDQTLEQLGALSSTYASNPEVLLLKAVSLSHSGELTAAQAVCQTLLERDELNAGAHYVLALCHEGNGNLDKALEHDQMAAYLDPGFAMPRLHLGLLERRRGETVGAQHDLKQAMLLLQKEEASRLLLFGGGFKREALIALCCAELASLGERV